MPESRDTTTPVPARPVAPAAVANVNVGAADNGFLGLTGWMKGLAQFSAVVIVFGLGTGVIVWTLNNDRADRREDRALFRETIKETNDEQNRRTGEVKGSVDKNTEVMRDLIAEFRSARHAGMIRTPAEPKAAPP